MLKLNIVKSNEGENSVSGPLREGQPLAESCPAVSDAWFAPELRRGNTPAAACRYRVLECAHTVRIRVVPRKFCLSSRLRDDGLFYFVLEETA